MATETMNFPLSDRVEKKSPFFRNLRRCFPFFFFLPPAAIAMHFKSHTVHLFVGGAWKWLTYSRLVGQFNTNGILFLWPFAIASHLVTAGSNRIRKNREAGMTVQYKIYRSASQGIKTKWWPFKGQPKKSQVIEQLKGQKMQISYSMPKNKFMLLFLRLQFPIFYLLI